MHASDTRASMGAACSAVLSNPLTAKRDFVERVLPAASTRSTPCSAAGRVRANATTFALRRVNGQVHSRAGNDPRPTAECIGACCECERGGIKIVRVKMSVTEYRNTEIDLLFLVLPYRREVQMENINRGFNFCISVSSHVTRL